VKASMKRIAVIAVRACLVTRLAACAVPATEVSVPTMPMRQALELAMAEGKMPNQTAGGPARLSAAAAPPGAPQPLLSTPEVRLAYVYEWVDPDGNKHFGEWVAIPIAGFDWLMNDGTRAPVDPPSREPASPMDIR